MFWIYQDLEVGSCNNHAFLLLAYDQSQHITVRRHKQDIKQLEVLSLIIESICVNPNQVYSYFTHVISNNNEVYTNIQPINNDM